MVGGFDVDGGAEIRLVNKDVNIQEGDMGRGDSPGKSDRVATIEALKEKEKGIMTVSPQQEDIINNKIHTYIIFPVLNFTLQTFIYAVTSPI